MTEPGLRALLSRARRLNRRTAREREGLFLLEGSHLLAEAVRTGWPLLGVLHTQEWAGGPEGVLLRGLRVPSFAVPESVLNEVTQTETPQGVLAVARAPRFAAGEVLKGAGPVLILLGVQDPGNLGTMIRAAEAAGAAGIWLGPGTVDPLNPKAVRAAMGSTLRLPVTALPPGGVGELRNLGYRIFGTAARGGEDYTRADLSGRIALVLGGEGRGLREGDFPVDGWLSIPLQGRVESLNVGVAAAVLLFEARRQRVNRA